MKTFEDKKRYMKRCSRLFSKYVNLTERLISLENEYDECSDLSEKSMLLMQIEDTKYRISMLYENNMKVRRSTLDIIDGLESQRHIDVLMMFFIDNLSLSDIAYRMGYSERHVIRLYKDGVNLLQIEQ